MTDRERLWREVEGNDTLKAAEELVKQLQRSGSAPEARRIIGIARDNIEKWMALESSIRKTAHPREPDKDGWVYVWDLFPEKHNARISPQYMRFVIQGEDFWSGPSKWDELLAFKYSGDLRENTIFDNKMNVLIGEKTNRVYHVACADKKGNGLGSPKEYAAVVKSRVVASMRRYADAEETINRKILCEVVDTVQQVFEHPYQFERT